MRRALSCRRAVSGRAALTRPARCRHRHLPRFRSLSGCCRRPTAIIITKQRRDRSKRCSNHGLQCNCKLRRRRLHRSLRLLYPISAPHVRPSASMSLCHLPQLPLLPHSKGRCLLHRRCLRLQRLQRQPPAQPIPLLLRRQLHHQRLCRRRRLHSCQWPRLRRRRHLCLCLCLCRRLRTGRQHRTRHQCNAPTAASLLLRSVHRPCGGAHRRAARRTMTRTALRCQSLRRMRPPLHSHRKNLASTRGDGRST